VVEKNSLVSIIIPTYKRPKKLNIAIESIINQTYINWELIIVDDNDEDSEYRKETEKFMTKYINNSKIKYKKHKENRGANAARNTGIKNARGDYIAFLDDDDIWLPKKLEIQMKEFKGASNKVGVVYSGFFRFEDKKREYIPKNLKGEGEIHKKLLKGNFISTQVAIVCKECFNKVGLFDECLPRLQDWELWIRISKYYRFKFVDQALAKVYFSEDSITANDEAWVKAQEMILKKHYSNFQNISKDVRGRHFYNLGNRLCILGNLAKGRKYILKAVRNSFNFKYLLALFLSFLGKDIYDLFNRFKKRLIR
jgi:glycosyltransferase involved in cell wall biosynthesis